MKPYNIGITGCSGSIGRALINNKSLDYNFFKLKGDIQKKEIDVMVFEKQI